MKTAPLPLEEAQARLLSLATPLPLERSDVDGALGRYLAEPLYARRTQPTFDLSAMDGYAVRAGDMAGPWRVVGESAAGHPHAGLIAPGEAVRIATGAVVPADAGAVILQEDLTRRDGIIELSGEAPVPPHKHIRTRGMDFADGHPLLALGSAIGPAQVALALAAGHKHLTVRRKPRVTIIESGDELAIDCENCPPHQIPASNGAMLAAMAASVPCDRQRIGPVADDLGALAAALDRAADADLVVTSGGASVGDHDLIRPALEAWGAQIDFWRIAIKPGKPLLVATRQSGARRQIVLGLPGNPVSSHISAFLFLLPVLRALLGAAEPLPRPVRTTLAAPLRASGARREFLRAQWDGAAIRAHPLQDSGALTPLAASNALIDRPAHAPAAAAGDAVVAYLLANGGMA
ncbi:MAG: molybdopterin molybdotransferase MoeA [Novosphingobium sp.]|nr:molybdopterin molybdotransferase MoeA [Novosphingobium sp.]